MQKNVEQPPVEKVTSRVVRVLGMNPSNFTLNGTNTWLVGTGTSRILIDTGDGQQPLYIKALRIAMEQLQITTIERIIITHWHFDHLGGVPLVQNTFGPNIPVHKFMPPVQDELSQGEGSKDPYKIWPKRNFIPIQHNDKISCEGATLQCLYTPGHANDHIAIVLLEEKSMFTGDNILGRGTTVFSDLGKYMQSLEQMLAMKPKNLYPGHGPVIFDSGRNEGQERIKAYIEHRKKRIKAIIHILSDDVIQCDTPSSTTICPILTTSQIVSLLYKDQDVPTRLIPAATQNTLLVLRKLCDDHLITLLDEKSALKSSFDIVSRLRWQWNDRNGHISHSKPRI